MRGCIAAVPMLKSAPMLSRTLYRLALIFVLAILFRLILAQFVHHPGIADPNHYYNVGRELAAGNGFQVDYVWEFYNHPTVVVHPEDHWMPLTSALAALPMTVLGPGVQHALLPFILSGALLSVLVYLAARQLGCSTEASLFAAALAAVLPEFVLNSVRTDTTIPNALLVGVHFLLLAHGLQTGRIWALIGSGLAGGLAYLTRNENVLLLPVFVLVLVAYWLRARRQTHWRFTPLVPAVGLIVVAPWLARNIALFGKASGVDLDRMLWWSGVLDQYVYSRPLTPQTFLASQSIVQIIGKRLFEMAASIKLMYTTLDVFLPIALAGGMLLLLIWRDRERLLILAPPLMLLGTVFVFYTVLLPFLSQAGSFKKAYLSLVPLLLPVAAYALECAVPNQTMRRGVMALATGLMALNAVELVRADIRFTDTYLETMQKVVTAARTLPDTNGDGQIILMSQDPFMLGFLGVKSVMIPAEDRETVLKVAQRYHVDYLLMPPDRPSLDPLYSGEETDPRFVAVKPVVGTPMVLYSLGPG